MKFGGNGKFSKHSIRIFAEISVFSELQEIRRRVGGVGRHWFFALFFNLAKTGNLLNILFAFAPEFPPSPKFQSTRERKEGGTGCQAFFFLQLFREVWRKREI